MNEQIRLDVRSALLWLVSGVLVGGVVLAAEPFGAGDRTNPELLNSYLLAFAPLFALNRLYLPVRRVRCAPRGLEERPTIGGRAMLPTCAVHALGPAAAFVWAENGTLVGGVLAGLLAMSWWIFLEVQRRTRTVLTPKAWTSRELDRLENNYEIAAIAALWAVAGATYAAAEPSSIPSLPDFTVGLLALGAVGTPLRAATVLVARRWPAALACAVLALTTAVLWRSGLWVPLGIAPALVWAVYIDRERRLERELVITGLRGRVDPQTLQSRYPWAAV